MAYMVAVDVECAKEGCSKRATHEVRNNRNGVIGRFCKRHAESMVAALTAREREQ